VRTIVSSRSTARSPGLAAGAERDFSPLDGCPQGPLGRIVGRLHARLEHERKEMIVVLTERDG